MRFKIHLHIKNKTALLPVDYQYLMSSAVYKLIKRGDEAYSQFLHDEGFSAGGLKRFKLFTFSPLQLPRYTLVKERGLFELHGKEASFIVSFMVDAAAEAFVKGMFVNEALSFGDKYNQLDTEIVRIESMPQPYFQETMEYKFLSPVTIGKRVAGEKYEKYLYPNDPEFGDFLINNLISKSLAYQTSGKEVFDTPFDGMKFELLGDYKEKLISIKPYTREQTKVKGSVFKFRLTAPVVLQEMGYYAGFGESNAMGFGCVEVG
ncbi:MAG TPA: CRISPR-associated endoribonuclease Cas6 [Cytophagaceae bacterium]